MLGGGGGTAGNYNNALMSGGYCVVNQEKSFTLDHKLYSLLVTDKTLISFGAKETENCKSTIKWYGKYDLFLGIFWII